MTRIFAVDSRDKDALTLNKMEEIVFQVEPCTESGALVAFWDDPHGGGITTQGKDLKELQEQVTDAVRCHFEDGWPRRIRLHFIADPILITV